MADSESKEDQPKRTVTKEKLRSIMEAASALTALGDEEDTQESTLSPTKSNEKMESSEQTDNEETSEEKVLKRYIPDHKKPDAALTFPEKVRRIID